MQTFLTEKFNSLFGKIFMVSFACMVIPLVITSYYAERSSYYSLEAEISSSMTSIAAEKRKQVDMALNNLVGAALKNGSDRFVVNYFKKLSENKPANPAEAQTIAANLESEFKLADGL